MEPDINAVHDAIRNGLPLESHWNINGTPVNYDFSVGHRRPHQLTEKDIGSGADDAWLQLVVFGEENHVEGGGARPWLCIHKGTGAVHGLDRERKHAVYILNSSIHAFIRTFQQMDAYLSKDQPLPQDLHQQIEALDPQSYHESEWRRLIDHMTKKEMAAPEPNVDSLPNELAAPSINGAEISRLRSDLLTATVIMYASLIFIPLSFVGGIALFKLENRIVQSFACPLALLGPFAGLAGLMLMGIDRPRYRRAIGFAMAGDKLGLQYVEKPGKSLVGQVNGFRPFDGHTDEAARDCLTGKCGQGNVIFMDYSCSWGRGGLAAVKNETVFVFPSAAPRVADFFVSPKTWLTKLTANFLSGNTVAVPGNDGFNNAYSLVAANAIFGAAVITKEIAALCLQEKCLIIEVRHGSILVMWSGVYIEPNQLANRLATAQRLVQLLNPT